MSTVGIIIPTWNNNEYFAPCLASILSPLSTEDLFHVYVVNNGDPANMKGLDHPRVTLLQQKDNIGWEGGLKAGLEASKEEFVVFMNDDTFVPITSLRWINILLNLFSIPEVAAVGPTSNCVRGAQSIFAGIPDYLDIIPVNYLIGFCMMVRRSALDEIGGVDDTLPGGDDLDLSIRFNQAGYKMAINRNVFIYHHGFKTGERVKGPPTVEGGWNSMRMQELTNWALIRKHGIRPWMNMLNQIPIMPQAKFNYESGWQSADTEGQVIQSIVGDTKLVLEIGCGMKKTVPQAVGVDRVPKGQQIPGVADGLLSQADIVADAQGPIPVENGKFDVVIARHILEHVVDPTSALREWGRVIKHGGRVVIAVPNHEMRNTIPMNIEHVHAWTPESLKNFMESQGWKTLDLLDPKNSVSFVGVFEANGLH